MSWTHALIATFVIVAAALFFSRWLEKKNYAQQQGLIERKKERLESGAQSNIESEEKG